MRITIPCVSFYFGITPSTLYAMHNALRFLVIALMPLHVFAGTRASPSQWNLWRSGPIAFPDQVYPLVPEYLQGSSPIRFDGGNLTIVVIGPKGKEHDDQALDWAVRSIHAKVPEARLLSETDPVTENIDDNLLILGADADSALLRRALGDSAGEFLQGIGPGGYRIATRPSPFNPEKQVIVALGRDVRGAWAAAALLAYSIHPDKPGVNVLRNWPVPMPSGCYWIPFEARASPLPDEYVATRTPPVPPRTPAVVFGVRIWGSPMPTLDSYRRVIRALKPTGINTVIVQSGGWVDQPDAPKRFVKALDIAWQEGIHTILYAGNEERAHLPAPLSENHRNVVLATHGHAGLLGYHLYNQLAAKLTAAELAEVKAQCAWMLSVTDKPVGMEVVWGHRIAEIPAEKVALMRNLKEWGVQPIATDYAPIGGWTDRADLSLWERKLLNLRPIEPRADAVLQAHVPFLESTVPSREQLRNQFWWAVAGGARGFMVETAYLFTHFSMRGLLSWDLRPLPDGRFDELTVLTAHAAKCEEMIARSQPVEAGAKYNAMFRLEGDGNVHLRLRTVDGDVRYALLINADLKSNATCALHGTPEANYRVRDVLHEQDLGATSAGPIHLSIPPGGAACLRLQPMTP